MSPETTRQVSALIDRIQTQFHEGHRRALHELLAMASPMNCAPFDIQPTVARDLHLMNSTPPQSSVSSPETDSDPATTDSARTALLDALNELLEAERAGARVAMETGRSITDPELAALVEDIHKDEVRWCGMLMRTIKSLGATPSSATGAFHGKAMAVADLDERLKFLNRGQAWVTRKLQALIPQVNDARARAELTDMLQAHHQNIGRVEARYTAPSKLEPPKAPQA